MKYHSQTRVKVEKILTGGGDQCHVEATGDSAFPEQITHEVATLALAFERAGLNSARAYQKAEEFLRGDGLAETLDVNGPAYLKPQPEA